MQALADVNLVAPAGKVTALVGDNGAGKSVLIKCIAGIHEPDGGEIVWEGRPVQDPQSARLRRPRHRGRLSGPRALRQSRRRAEHVPRARAASAAACSNEDDMERAAAETLASLRVATLALDPSARRLALRRPAPGDRGRESGHVELEARHPRRADRGARRRADEAGSRACAAPGRPWARRHHGLPQSQRRVRRRRPHRRAAPGPDGRRGRRRQGSIRKASSN